MKMAISKENKNRRWSCSPVRILNKIGDFYVKIVSGWANKMDSAGVGVTTLPKSFSMSSSIGSSREHDLAELVRIASRRGLAERVESEFLRRQKSTRMNNGLHSRSVGMRKIDEDEGCDFNGGGGDGFKINRAHFARSKSHVMPARDDGML